MATKNYEAIFKPLLAHPQELALRLKKESGLPGPRANLEIAAVLSRMAARAPEQGFYELALPWALLSSEEAETNTPEEYLTVVGIRILGGLYALSNTKRQQTIRHLFEQRVVDTRWRSREAVAMALQDIGEAAFDEMVSIVTEWASGSRLFQRAVLVALAHPPFLNEERAIFALKIADGILKEARWQEEEGRILKAAFEFAPSVYVTKAPKEGFALLRCWASHADKTTLNIVAKNLRKSRLAKSFAEECLAVFEILQERSNEL